jgi:hypothetical protein
MRREEQASFPDIFPVLEDLGFVAQNNFSKQCLRG